MMINFLVILLAFLTGVFSKFADILEDSEKFPRLKKYSMFFGLIYGLLIGIVIFIEPILISLALGTILALILMKKIDGKSHIAGVILVFVLLLFFYFLTFGISFLNLLLVIIFFIANILDEIASNLSDKRKIKFENFFRLRPFLELFALVISILSNQWIIWFTILSYDIAYYILSRLERE